MLYSSEPMTIKMHYKRSTNEIEGKNHLKGTNQQYEPPK
uniref:Uncharacterized protein n=1 Tax=Rhizophora mucronata TaxID=61149 RepID=A0A2P2N5X2_RHIMU